MALKGGRNYEDKETLNRVSAVNENTTNPLANVLASYSYAEPEPSVRWTGVSPAKDGALNTLAHDLSGTANDVTYGFDYTLANQLGLKTVTNALYTYAPPVNDTKAYVVNGLNQYASVTTTGQGQTTANLAYDANGSITGDGTWTYAYDAENRLISASGQGSTVTFEYDPLGRRSAKVVNGVRTEYLSDGVEEIGDYDAAGAILRRYVHGPGIDEPVVMYTGAGTTAKQYYHANYQGSVIAMTDSAGVAVDIYTYDPHGNSTTLTGNPFRYTGRRLDAETGLYYYRARYYSPALGRFLQTDPIGYGDGLNWYAYVGNDPVNGTDPTGEFATAIAVCAASVACGGAVVAGLVATGVAIQKFVERRGSKRKSKTRTSPTTTNRKPEGRTVFRVFGNTSPDMNDGKPTSFTTIDPRTMENPRDELGLPEGNSMTEMITGRVIDDTGVVERPALPIESQGVIGGAPEVIVPQARVQVEVLNREPFVDPCENKKCE